MLELAARSVAFGHEGGYAVDARRGGEHREDRTEGESFDGRRDARGARSALRDGPRDGEGRERGWTRREGGARADEAAAAAAAVTAAATAGGARAREYVWRKGERQGGISRVGVGMSSPRCGSRVAAFDVIRSWSALFRANVSRERDHREIRIVNISASVRVCM